MRFYCIGSACIMPGLVAYIPPSQDKVLFSTNLSRTFTAPAKTAVALDPRDSPVASPPPTEQGMKVKATQYMLPIATKPCRPCRCHHLVPPPSCQGMLSASDSQPTSMNCRWPCTNIGKPPMRRKTSSLIHPAKPNETALSSNLNTFEVESGEEGIHGHLLHEQSANDKSKFCQPTSPDVLRRVK